MKIPQFSKRKGGFTLIELMVAMAITTVIVTVLVAITGIAMDAWQRGRAEIRASRQAKSMLDTMAKDFESFVSRRGNNFDWLYAKVTDDLPGPSSNQSSNSAKLLLFTAATDRYLGDIGGTKDLGGDVSCVGYSLEYQDPISGKDNADGADSDTFVFYRLLIDPKDTFDKLLGQEDLDGAFQSFEASMKKPENFVCENIYQFTLTFHVDVTQQTGNTTTTVPVRVTLGDSGAGKELRMRGDGIKTDANAGSLKPQVTPDELKAGRLTGVEIGVTVLSDAAVIRLGAGNLDQKVREKIIAQESFQFSRTVELPGM